jgi:hypothetical protein
VLARNEGEFAIAREFRTHSRRSRTGRASWACTDASDSPTMCGVADGSFNSTDEQRRRGRGSGGVTGRGFQPGRSGCPGGRPRQDVTELARAHTTDAIQALVEALKRPKEAVPAAIALLNRGWGLPRQTIETNDTANPIGLHLLAAQLVSAEILAAMEQRTINGHADPANGQAKPAAGVDLLDAPPPLE